MRLAFGPIDSKEAVEPFYDVSSADIYEESGSYQSTDSERVLEDFRKETIAGEVPSLVFLALQAIADHFDILYEKVLKIPEECWNLFTKILPVNVDIGNAALVVRDGYFWKKCTLLKYPGFHQIENAGNSWKRYFLERYFAEYIEEAESDSIDYLEAKRLAESFSPFIHKLEIRQMNVPRWPEILEMTDSTDSNDSKDSIMSGMSKMTLYAYMNRHVKYADHPSSTDRIYLGTIFRALHRLEELKICFGYKNYYRYDIMSFARILKLDALRLASAIEAIHRLRKLTITRSIIPREMFELIRDSIECHEYLHELELSRMQLGDECIVDIVHILVNVPALRILSLKENGITTLGVSVLAYALMHRKIRLKVLDLSYNPLDDIGGSILASLVLHQGFLNKLYLRGCNLGPESGINFGMAIKYNVALSVLDLSANKFDYEAGESLLRGLEANQTLNFLDVRGCELPSETVNDINDICFEHTEMQRKKSPVYKYVLPLKRKPPSIYLDYGEEYGEMSERASRQVIEVKEEIKEEPLPLSVTSDDFSDISDFYNIQKEALQLAGYTGTFSSGFGAYIENYAEITRRKQRERRVLSEATEEIISEPVLLRKIPSSQFYDKYGMPTTGPPTEESSRGTLLSQYGESEMEEVKPKHKASVKESSDEQLEHAKRYFQIGKRKKKTSFDHRTSIKSEDAVLDRRSTLQIEKQLFQLRKRKMKKAEKPVFKSKRTESDEGTILFSLMSGSKDTMRQKQGSKLFEKPKAKAKPTYCKDQYKTLIKQKTEEPTVSLQEEISTLEEPRGSAEIPSDIYNPEVSSIDYEHEIDAEPDIPFWRPQTFKRPGKKSISRTRRMTSERRTTIKAPHRTEIDEVPPKVVNEKTWKEIFDGIMESTIETAEDVFTFKNFLNVPPEDGKRKKADSRQKLMSTLERMKKLKEIELKFSRDEGESEKAKEPLTYGYTSEIADDAFQADDSSSADDELSEEENSEAGITYESY